MTAPYDTPDAVISANVRSYGPPLGFKGPSRLQRLIARLRKMKPVTQHFLLRIIYRDYSERAEIVNFPSGTMPDFLNQLLSAPNVRAVECAELLVKARKSFGADYDPSNWIKLLQPEPEPEPTTPDTFQARVQPWMLECFGAEIAADGIERNHRFLEEALELVQSTGCTADEAHQLVDYVFGRPAGDPPQEVGGVQVTLAALCLAHGFDMHQAGEIELARIWTKVEQIRAKQAAKPKHSPLPQGPHPSHITRSSDASTFDEICTVCGATDIAGNGWGKLAEPCEAQPETADAARGS